MPRKSICIIFIYILCPLRRSTHGSKKFGRVCARRLRQKGETEKRAYHNSIYRFIFYFRLYILLSFLQRGKERERKKRKGRLSLFRQLFSHFIPRGEGLLISTTRVRGLWVRHKKRKEKQKKNTGCVQTKERNVRPFKRASNLQRTSHSGASAL